MGRLQRSLFAQSPLTCMTVLSYGLYLLRFDYLYIFSLCPRRQSPMYELNTPFVHNVSTALVNRPVQMGLTTAAMVLGVRSSGMWRPSLLEVWSHFVAYRVRTLSAVVGVQ